MPPSLYDGPGPGTYILPSTIGQDVERKGPPSFSMGVKTKGGGFLDHVGAANLPGPAQYHLPPTTFDSPAKTMGPKLTLPTLSRGPGPIYDVSVGILDNSHTTRIMECKSERKVPVKEKIPAPNTYRPPSVVGHEGPAYSWSGKPWSVQKEAMKKRKKEGDSQKRGRRQQQNSRPTSRPGPGAYTLPSTLSGGRKDGGPRFSSRRPAFQRPLQVISDLPGPGDYACPQYSAFASDGPAHRFVSRPTALKPATDVPGPAAYDVERGMAATEPNAPAPLLSALPEKKGPSPPPQPGPGSYPLPSLWSSHEGGGAHTQRSTDTDAIFARLAQPKPKREDGPGPARYLPQLPMSMTGPKWSSPADIFSSSHSHSAGVGSGKRKVHLEISPAPNAYLLPSTLRDSGGPSLSARFIIQSNSTPVSPGPIYLLPSMRNEHGMIMPKAPRLRQGYPDKIDGPSPGSYLPNRRNCSTFRPVQTLANYWNVKT